MNTFWVATPHRKGKQMTVVKGTRKTVLQDNLLIELAINIKLNQIIGNVLYVLVLSLVKSGFMIHPPSFMF